MGNDVNCLLRIGHAEVIEHNTVYASVVKHLLQLVKRAYLNLNLQVESLLFQVSMTAVNGVGNTTGKVHVVVLQEYHVEQADAMVRATADLDGLLLEHTHTRSGLAGIEHTGTRAFQPLYILVGHRGNAAHALHDIQHQSLRLKQRAHFARNNHGNVTLLHTGTIAHQHLHLHLRIEAAEHFLGNFHTSQNTVFLDQQMRLSHCILRNAAQSSMVTVTDILGKRQVYQPVN